MGNLAEFERVVMPLTELGRETGRYFVKFIETGSGAGKSIEWGIDKELDVISIEIVPETVQRMREKFKYSDRVEMVEGSSRERLHNVIKMCGDVDCLIFLDAHCPGQFNPDVDKTEVTARYSHSDKHPLHDEVKICMGFNHVVLIDDANAQVNLELLKRQLTDGWEMRYWNIAKGYALLIPPE